MSVVGFARERFPREASFEEENKRTYRRVFLVTCDSRYDGPLVAMTAPGLPQRFFPYITETEIDYGALCNRVHASRLSDKSAYEWLVECEYATDHDDEEKNKPETRDDPLAEPAEVSFSFENFRVPVTGVVDEQYLDSVVTADPAVAVPRKAIVNSAGEPFDPPGEKDESRPVLTITRNEAFFNPAVAIDYQDAVNSDPFFGAAARQAKVKQISAVRQQKKGVRFWRVTYEVVFRRETWDLQLLDHGTYYLDGSGKKQDDFSNDGNVKTVLLDGSGHKLGAGVDPKFLRFKVYAEKAFSVLQLPQTVSA